MVKQHALVRRLIALETLRSVTFICSDKTGTLTHNKMRVTAIYADGALHDTWQDDNKAEPWSTLFHASALSNDAHLDRYNKAHGEPTETALLIAAQTAGWDKTALKSEAPRLKELPFDSERKRMTTFHGMPENTIAYTKGSPETVLPYCERVLMNDGEQNIVRAALIQKPNQWLPTVCAYWR